MKQKVHILAIFICLLCSCRSLTYTQLPFTNVNCSQEQDWARGSEWGDSVRIWRRATVRYREGRLFELTDITGSPFDLHHDSVSVWLNDSNLHIRQISAKEISNISYSQHKDTIYIRQDNIESPDTFPTHTIEYSIPLQKTDLEILVIKINNSFVLPIIPKNIAQTAKVYPIIRQQYQAKFLDAIIGHWESIQSDWQEYIHEEPSGDLKILDIYKNGTWVYRINNRIEQVGIFCAREVPYHLHAWAFAEDGDYGPFIQCFRNIRDDIDFKQENYKQIFQNDFPSKLGLDMWPNFMVYDGHNFIKLKEKQGIKRLFFEGAIYYNKKYKRRSWEKVQSIFH